MKGSTYNELSFRKKLSSNSKHDLKLRPKLSKYMSMACELCMSYPVKVFFYVAEIWTPYVGLLLGHICAVKKLRNL